jgi:hypothetical protein
MQIAALLFSLTMKCRPARRFHHAASHHDFHALWRIDVGSWSAGHSDQDATPKQRTCFSPTRRACSSDSPNTRLLAPSDRVSAVDINVEHGAVLSAPLEGRHRPGWPCSMASIARKDRGVDASLAVCTQGDLRAMQTADRPTRRSSE